jgi:sec-independent protein translocase protein TatA
MNKDGAVGPLRRRKESLMEGLLEPTHLFFILLIVLIIFGPGKLPELGKGLGKGIREFKGALQGGLSDNKESNEKKS